VIALSAVPVQATPWWAVPLLSGVFVFIGVTFAQVVVLYTDRRKSAREDRTRWHNERRVLYSQFAKALGDLAEVITSDHESQVSADETFAKVDERLSGSYEELTFLAGREVISAASSARSALEALVNKEPDDDDVSADFTRSRFVNAAREELGITKPERRYAISSDSLRELTSQLIEVVIRSAFPTFFR
jgi:hypothetical protein